MTSVDQALHLHRVLTLVQQHVGPDVLLDDDTVLQSVVPLPADLARLLGHVFDQFDVDIAGFQFSKFARSAYYQYGAFFDVARYTPTPLTLGHLAAVAAHGTWFDPAPEL